MDCEEFLSDYSDFLDLRFEEHPRERYREHLQACQSCAAYDRVLRRGLELVRQLEAPGTPPDFLPLVKGRVMGAPRSSGVPSGGRRGGAVAAGLAAAALVVAVVVAGLAAPGDTVELPPVVVEPSVGGEVPSLWGPAPRFTPSIDLLQVPDLSNDRLFTPESERLSLFRAPLRREAGSTRAPPASME